MDAKTGNDYISGTVTDSIRISMANPGFSTMPKTAKLNKSVAK